VHKKLLAFRKHYEELKRIASQKNKTLTQLKGGTATSEFYSTYQSFEIKNEKVYPDSALLAPELLEDSPINLKDPILLE